MAQWFRRFVDVFLLFRYYLPLEKVRAFHFYKLESPSPKDALWKVLLKLALWFWRISRFSNCVTLGKGHALSILECFVPSLVEIGSVVLEKYKKKWKVYNNDDDDDSNNDDDGKRTNFNQKSSLVLSA